MPHKFFRLAAVFGSLLMVSCSGPQTPIEISTKEIPVDIVLGEQNKKELPAPPPGVNLTPIGFPGFIEPPPPRRGPQNPGFVPPPKAGPCPVANPADPADRPAQASAFKPPVPEPYAYRNQGYYETAGLGKIQYPEEIVRTVQNVVPGDAGNYDFQVSIMLGDQLTTTSYRVINDVSQVERGVYMTQVVSPGPKGFDSFTPSPPILLMPFPGREFGTNLEDETARLVGRKYRSSGTDASQQTSMVLEAQIDSKLLIDACGHWVDSWDIEVTNGQIIGPGRSLNFTGHYYLATQYGALIVRDDLVFMGSDGADKVTIKNVATINRVPREPS